MAQIFRPTRRAVLGVAATAGIARGTAAAATPYSPSTAQRAIPRWRGFNLLDLFQALAKRHPEPVAAEELRWIRDWGFNFIRIPMDYWHWVDSHWRNTRRLSPEDVVKIKESALEPVDRIVELGRRYGLHVSLNFHRAPGYCINGAEREPYVLWSDSRAEDAFVHHWDFFAKRYREFSEFDLSFNLVNEAPAPREGYMRREDYARVMRMGIEKIRETSPRRLIFVDGLSVGTRPVDELVRLGVPQSVHAYWPSGVSHYRAGWVDRESKFPPPQWPVLDPETGAVKMGREQLEERYLDWGSLARQGVGVHCGECGCFNRTPHGVFLAWFRDVLEVLEGYNIGWALWNFRGSFGLLDSGREDVDYEDWHGRKLDRRLLALLQQH